MKITFEESPDCGEWICEIPLSDFDPFEKGVATLATEIDDVDEIGPSLGDFADEFVKRYREFWPHIEKRLLDWGWSWHELKEAHQCTRIELEDDMGNPPESWELSFGFLFENGHTLALGLAFEGWSPDDHLGGCH